MYVQNRNRFVSSSSLSLLSGYDNRLCVTLHSFQPVDMNVTPALRTTHIGKARAGRRAKGRNEVTFFLKAFQDTSFSLPEKILHFSILSCATRVSSAVFIFFMKASKTIKVPHNSPSPSHETFQEPSLNMNKDQSQT